jgi:hypothetical protein
MLQMFFDPGPHSAGFNGATAMMVGCAGNMIRRAHKMVGHQEKAPCALAATTQAPGAALPVQHTCQSALAQKPLVATSRACKSQFL